MFFVAFITDINSQKFSKCHFFFWTLHLRQVKNNPPFITNTYQNIFCTTSKLRFLTKSRYTYIICMRYTSTTLILLQSSSYLPSGVLGIHKKWFVFIRSIVVKTHTTVNHIYTCLYLNTYHYSLLKTKHNVRRVYSEPWPWALAEPV